MWNFFKKNKINKKIYLKNTLTRKKDIFEPVNNNSVSMYHCGPTVYNKAHIGNMRSFVFADLLGRLFRYLNYNVNQVINITDVGHLVSDADEGEDKIEKSARESGKTAKEITETYTNLFFDDLDKLNIEKNKITFPKATDHINEQIEIIKKLELKKLTYKIDDGIYFDTSKVSYGILGNIKVDEQKEGTRIEKSFGKKNLTDFALWKFSQKDEERQQEWDSPWGIGFPGWHLECSAMSHKYLGKKFDIHTGGIEHIQIHHNNEIVQSQNAFGEIPANYWMHNGHVLMNNEKMSKSKNNVIYLDDFESRDIDPIVYRYWLLTSHYSSLINFSWEAIHGANVAYNKILNHFKNTKLSKGFVVDKYLDKAISFIRDDLNTASAIAIIFDLLKDSKISPEDQYSTIIKIDDFLGLDLDRKIKQNCQNLNQNNIPPDIVEKAQKRQNMRKLGDYEGADRLRDELSKAGYEVIDKGEEFEVLKK